MKGYAGKLLRVDLISSSVTEVRLDEAEQRNWVGGAGICARYLYAEVPPGVEWSAPENRLILASGPLGATRIPGGGTFSVSTRGPMTGGAASSQANGFFGAFLKMAGADGIIIQGAAPRLTYLYIHDGIAEVRDARHLAGMDAFETEDIIRKELGRERRGMSVATIGPAGENRVRFAGINVDSGHFAGHNGTGAVMGSKRLKAIAVARGKARIEVADEARVSQLAGEILDLIRNSPNSKRIYEFGTLGTYGNAAKAGALPIKNWTTNVYPDPTRLDKYTAAYIRSRFEPRPDPCWACQMHHCHESTITEGEYRGRVVEEPEFECLSAMGSQIGNMEPASAMMLIDEVDRLGLEMNETGWVVGFVMECFEKGVLTARDTGGLEVTWGNAAAVKELLGRIARREGIGNLLAEGVMRAARQIGGQAPEFAVHTLKGNTPRGYDYRAYTLEQFDCLTSNTATIESRPFPLSPVGVVGPEDVVNTISPGKARMYFEDTLGTCRFATLVDLPVLAEAVKAVTGWDFDAEEARTVGFRILNLFRAFNYRHGHSRALEAPSPRYGSAQVDGPALAPAIAPTLDRMLDGYYQCMGWDVRTGRPLPETLRRLGLESIIKDLAV